jgi:DNA-binding XRE family transcriptional regulator
VTTQVQTLTVGGKQFAVLPWSEYERLRALARAGDDRDLPAMPEPDAQGNYPAVPYARASLARKIVRRRWAAGLNQAELARRAGIRPETLNRIERATRTPGVATVEKIVRALERAEAEAAEVHRAAEQELVARARGRTKGKGRTAATRKRRRK